MFQDLAEKFYAPREVIEEIKDEKTRLKLELLVFEIEIREPSPESLKLGRF